MSQVILKELEIVGLKNQNKNMENVALKKEEERKSLEYKCRELLDKIDKLAKRLTRQLPI